ncbi:hypothetical protein GA0116948_105248 [Chitinophaga costaii]|uniref:Uncharacterized protein n=1 Tax=Chitinophaga costaii TaxID=1335309 RepID=A0A1C4DFY4_9BACT|nr:hypothetical protein GA0116948_105248 [Chitinophaga costaii]
MVASLHYSPFEGHGDIIRTHHPLLSFVMD